MARVLKAPAIDPGQPGAAQKWARYYRSRASRAYRRARKDQRHADWLRTVNGPWAIGPDRWDQWAAEEREHARWCAQQAREFQRETPTG